MRIITKAKNLEITEALGLFIEEKFDGLKKFIDAEVFVEVEKETKHHNKGMVFLVKTRVVFPGRSLIAEAREDDLYKAIISAKDELKMEIEKYKVKKIDQTRRQQRESKAGFLKMR